MVRTQEFESPWNLDLNTSLNCSRDLRFPHPDLGAVVVSLERRAL